MRKLTVCKKCGRYLKAKRWLEPQPGVVERAKEMGRLELTVCEDCQKSATTHNAILQVRGFPENELEKIIENELAKGDPHTDKAFFRAGNYHFTRKATARAVARKLHELGAKIKETAKIVTYDNLRSRQLLRITIIARFDFLPGDVVEYKGKPYLVDKIKGNFVFSQSGHKFPIKDAKKIENVGRKKGFYISQNPPLVFVEKTGETVDVGEKGEGKVELVEAEGKRWVRKLL